MIEKIMISMMIADTLIASRYGTTDLAAVAIGSIVVLGSAALPPAPRLVWNASASAPIGQR